MSLFMIQTNKIIIYMKAQQTIIGGRYSYNTNDPLRVNDLYRMYKVYDKVTKRDLSMILMASREDGLIEMLRDVKHPFVLLVFDVIKTEDTLAIFTQSGSIATLQQILNSNGYLLEEDSLVIIKTLTLALRELHEKMIIYGRLCLENVLLCNLSLIKIGYNVFDEQMPLQFLSPEVLKGEKPTYSSDIFSLGVILYKMIYGVFPFEGQSQTQLIKKIKSKSFNQSYKEGHSPFKITVSKQTEFLVESMLDFYVENRPSIDQILTNSVMGFEIQTQLQKYAKPKINLLPQPFIKKYSVFRATKTVHRYDAYYQQSSFMALSIKEKKMVTIYSPQIKMFQGEPRKVESYYQKLKALQSNYNEQTGEFLIKMEDMDKFRQQPILVTQYCNQGNLYNYLQKRKVSDGWLNEKETNILMYVTALALRQMREIGVTSIHTLNSQRVMIKDKNVKLRQPGLLTPSIEKRLIDGRNNLDYFAPELKQNMEMVELDKSDMWSYGVLYFYFLSGKLPAINQEGEIQIDDLKTNQKNKNIIGKCLDYSVEKRLELPHVKLENVDEELLDQMLKEKRQAEGERIVSKVDEKSIADSQSQNEEQIMKDKKVMFKHRKKKVFKDYNKIIAESSTSTCRIYIKTLVGIMLLLFIFFGLFFINGGNGLFRSYYFKKITLEVPYNFGTSLKNMTILAPNGLTIQNQYSKYSYEQFTTELKCVTDPIDDQAPGNVYNFINSTNTVFCFFGFIWMILVMILYGFINSKLDLVNILHDRKRTKDNKKLLHYVFLIIMLPSLCFTFFYTYAIEYLMQINPCFGIESLAYPKFTSIHALLSEDNQTFFLNVFLTVVVWAILMFLYGFLSLFVKRVNFRVNQWKLIILYGSVMFVFTVICRIGFGSSQVIEPTWSHRMNQDISINTYYGFFGFFPEVLFLLMWLVDRLIDLIFWYCLKRGLEGEPEEDIKHVKIIKARYEPIQEKKLDHEKSNIYMIQADFERFD